MNYHVTQFLSGHDTFNAYLHRFKRRDSAECRYCGDVETMEHVVFECPQLHENRHELQVEIDRTITPNNVIHVMLEKMTNALVAIIRTK